MAPTSTTSDGLLVIPSEQLTKLNDYPVASGGYGQVFRCTMRSQTTPEALVAVKVLMRLNGDAPKRARREMKLWMEAKHDNIVPMLGITDGFSDEGFAMVSPWIGGGTLARYLEVHAGTIHIRKKLTLLKDTAQGLAYLHSRQIVHGDLTTNNIMLDHNDKAMLIDFGLSHVLEGIDGSCLTPSPARPGAVRFAAPELLGAEEATGQSTGEDSPVDYQSPMPNVRSDIYSLGCVMLTVFTEQSPWYRHHKMAFLGDLHARKPIPIPAHNHISEERRKLICECTSFQANGRPSSQYVADVIEEELHAEDALERSMLEASSRNDLPFVMHKLDTEMPRKVALTSIRQPSVDLCDQINSHDDGITLATIHSESSYSTCLTSLLDDSHDGASSRTRNAPTAMQRPNLGVPVPTGDVPTTTEMPNHNSPTVLINSSSRECNIVVAGAIGSGKSSLVNILSGEPVAQTSINAERCTGEWMGYQSSFCNTKYRVFDTVGFAYSNDTSLGPKEQPEKYENRQIEEIYERRSIDLLLLCVPIRNFRVQTVLDVHKRIQGQFHGRHVPVVLVFTHFEERSIIDRWWSKNSSTLQAQLNSIANHICILSIDDKCLDESRKHIFQIIAQHRTSVAGEPWQRTPESGDVHPAAPSRNLLGDVAWAPRVGQISAWVRGAVMSGLGLRPHPS